MLSKMTFVMVMIFLACFVVVLSWFGWMNGYAWSRRKENLHHA